MDETGMVMSNGFVAAKGQMAGPNYAKGGASNNGSYSRFEQLTFDGGGASVPIVRRDPGSPPTAAMRSRAMRFDGSREQFMVGNGTKVSELLAAIPMIKADPVTATAITVSASSPVLELYIRFPSAAPTDPAFYDNTTSPTTLATRLGDTAFDLRITRLGMAFSAMDTDSISAAVGTPMNALAWQAQTAAVAVLRKLDKAMAQGQGSETPKWFWGLSKICSAGAFNRTAATSGNVDSDARNIVSQIVPNGYGAGDGIDCFIGGPKVLRKLMSTSAGQQGQSGFRFDPRIGRSVYHYMGIPYYRTETDESTTGVLYGANLGPTGLNLVYVVGTPQSYGLTVDTFTSPSTLQKTAVVHGAFALVPWEGAAVYEITGIDISSL